MAEKYETHSADVVEQTRQIFVENLRGRRWRPVRELEALIPDALAEARLAAVNPLATAGQADPKSYGRLRLRMDAVKALEESAVCEVRGAEGKEEIRLVAQDGAPETAARQAATATASEKSGTKAAPSAPQLDVRGRGKGAGVPATTTRARRRTTRPPMTKPPPPTCMPTWTTLSRPTNRPTTRRRTTVCPNRRCNRSRNRRPPVTPPELPHGTAP